MASFINNSPYNTALSRSLDPDSLSIEQDSLESECERLTTEQGIVDVEQDSLEIGLEMENLEQMQSGSGDSTLYVTAEEPRAGLAIQRRMIQSPGEFGQPLATSSPVVQCTPRPAPSVAQNISPSRPLDMRAAAAYVQELDRLLVRIDSLDAEVLRLQERNQRRNVSVGGGIVGQNVPLASPFNMEAAKAYLQELDGLLIRIDHLDAEAQRLQSRSDQRSLDRPMLVPNVPAPGTLNMALAEAYVQELDKLLERIDVLDAEAQRLQKRSDQRSLNRQMSAPNLPASGTLNMAEAEAYVQELDRLLVRIDALDAEAQQLQDRKTSRR